VTQDRATEFDSVFCANTTCGLYLRPGDANVRGRGNWAQLPDGTMVGRQRIENTMLCDRCARKVLQGTLLREPSRSAEAREPPADVDGVGRVA
jgi:hypothetical protein